MSWMQDLVTAYDENERFAGKKNSGFKFVLPPVGHIVQNMHIELTLNENGNIIIARVLGRQEQATLIPCTLFSASRSSNIAPHPLHDKLSYIARDCGEFAPKTKKNAHEDYINLLRKWIAFAPENRKLQAVLAYVENHDPVHDLIERKILLIDEHHNIEDSLKMYVRFCVRLEDDDQPNLWEDEELQESWQRFLLKSGFLTEKRKESSGEDIILNEGLCYVTGKKGLLANIHSRGIRFPGDGTKLISSNDKDGFTFRGRFDKAEECVGISYEASQKAMNALMWLVRNQGCEFEKRVFLAWANTPIPSVFNDTDNIIANSDDFGVFLRNQLRAAGIFIRTQAQWAEEMKKALAGISHVFKKKEDVKVHVMILDSALTDSKGRLAICYYDTMDGTDFINRIEKWHMSSSWRNHSYDIKHRKAFEYFGMPSPEHILESYIGDTAKSAQKKMELSRIFRAIIQGKTLPIDIERRAMQRVAKHAHRMFASTIFAAMFHDHPHKIEGKDKDRDIEMRTFAWFQELETTCSIICNRRNYAGEENQVALDEQNTNRSYLFGRLLAVADQMERRTFDKDEKRATNAMRLMEAFAARPQKTWLYLQQRLMPYQKKREAKGGGEKLELFKIGSLFREEDFMSDKPLDGRYLLGFYCQEYAMQKTAEEEDE